MIPSTPTAEAAESGAREMSREALVATIAVWAGSDSGKAAIAEALRLAGMACDELTASRRVDYRMMDIPIGVSAPASDGDLVAEIGQAIQSTGQIHADPRAIALLARAADAIERLTLELDEADSASRVAHGVFLDQSKRATAAEAKLDAATRVIAELVAAEDQMATLVVRPRTPRVYEAIATARALIAESGSKT